MKIEVATRSNPDLVSDKKEHREWIVGRVYTLLAHYFRHDEPPELSAALGRDWVRCLDGIPKKYIEQACIKYLQEEPRRKPTPGEIYQRATALMPEPSSEHLRSLAVFDDPLYGVPERFTGVR